MEINATEQTRHTLSNLKTNMLLAYLTLHVCFLPHIFDKMPHAPSSCYSNVPSIASYFECRAWSSFLLVVFIHQDIANRRLSWYDCHIWYDLCHLFHASSCSSEYSFASFHPLDTVSLKICTVPSEETSSAKTLVLIQEWPSILDPQYLRNTEDTKNMPYSWQLLSHV